MILAELIALLILAQLIAILTLVAGIKVAIGLHFLVTIAVNRHCTGLN